jgi:hypothetical protein
MDNIAAAKAYIQQRLSVWLDLFPGLRMRYYFEPCLYVHFVKLDPASYPMDDERLQYAQIALIFRNDRNYIMKVAIQS